MRLRAETALRVDEMLTTVGVTRSARSAKLAGRTDPSLKATGVVTATALVTEPVYNVAASATTAAPATMGIPNRRIRRRRPLRENLACI